MNKKRTVILPIFLPWKGCPGRCSYCNQSISGKPTFSLEPESLEGDVENFRASLAEPEKIRLELAFYGGSFTGLPDVLRKSLLDQAASLRKRGLISSIRISGRPDQISDDLVMELKLAGVSIVELGVPSLDDRILELARRGHDSHAVETALNVLSAHGMITGFQLMIGLPGETRHSLSRTLDRVCMLHPDFVRIHPTIVFRETLLAEMTKSGAYHPLTLQRAIVITAKWLSRFEGCGIAVHRLGLQSLDVMREPGTIIAGPHHPAFGALVREFLMRKRLLTCYRDSGLEDDRVEFSVPSPSLSQAIGMKRHTISWLHERYPHLRTIRIVPNQEADDAIRCRPITDEESEESNRGDSQGNRRSRHKTDRDCHSSESGRCHQENKSESRRVDE